MTIDVQALRGLLELAVITGGGSLVYGLLAKWPRYQTMPSDVKRYIAGGANALIAILGYLGLVLFKYTAAPPTALAWIETLVGIGSALFGASQMVHAAKDLVGKKG